MFEGEIKYFIKNELEKIRIAKEKEKNRYGGYCSSNCRRHYKEFLTEHGISADFTDEIYMGHNLHHGSFCKDYY